MAIEQLLMNFILYDNWYFVWSFNIEKALGFRFLFDSLINLSYTKNMMTDKYDETEIAVSIDNDDSRQLSLILKSFVGIRENENFVVKADFEKK